jgi:hypothetical protein
MPFEKTVRSFGQAARNAKAAARQGLQALRGDIAIAIYPLFVFILVLGSLTAVNDLISNLTESISQQSFIEPEQRLLGNVFSLTSFLLFYLYLAIMTGIFTSVVAASVTAQLDSHPTPLLKGAKVVLQNLPRIIMFSCLSILFIPLGFMAQRRKWHNKPHDVVGSSFSLNMAQLAPAILSGKQGIFNTIRLSVSVMGEAWKENLLIKGSMYGVIILLGAISFLPSYVEHNWFDKASAETVSWLMGVIIFISFLIMTRVMASVITATLYRRVTNKKS